MKATSWLWAACIIASILALILQKLEISPYLGPGILSGSMLGWLAVKLNFLDFRPKTFSFRKVIIWVSITLTGLTTSRYIYLWVGGQPPTLLHTICYILIPAMIMIIVSWVHYYLSKRSIPSLSLPD